jgi:SAM-dependent methyltransferase
VTSLSDLDTLKALLNDVVEELGADGPHWNRHLDTLKVFASLKLPRDSVVLDVGCGAGHLSLVAKRLGYNVHALDINPDKSEHVFKKHNIPVIRLDVEREPLPFTEETFDCVICAEVIEHLDPRTVDHVLSEIFRVLHVGGVLLLTTPNLASFQNRVRLLLGRKVIISYDHVREYVTEELLEPLKKIGFLTFYAYLLAFDKPAFSKVRDARINVARAFLYPLRLMVPRFRSTILILARKDRQL